MTEPPVPDKHRSIELEIEVTGSPEEVWRAIATGPGISSWYVPHEIDEREGGRAIASFGSDPSMQAPGRVAAWEPHHRIVLDGGEGAEGLAFEWLIETHDGQTCVVRLVNSGFLEGDEWDDYFDAMTEGWGIFLDNLRLHMAHFAGQSARASLPLATWAGPRDDAWGRLTTALAVPARPEIGSRIETAGAGSPVLAGEVAFALAHRMTILVDDPSPGVAFIAAEGRGDSVEVSIWSYLYGDDGAAVSARDEPAWQAWLSARSADSH